MLRTGPQVSGYDSLDSLKPADVLRKVSYKVLDGIVGFPVI